MDGLVAEARAGILARIGRLLRAAVLPSIFIACSAYFVWHALNGERGLWAKAERQDRVVAALAERDRVQAELAAMERRVQALRGERLDTDQLEERARQLLNMIGRDEIVVPYGPERRLF